MDFIYDNNSQPLAMVYDGTTYYYMLNLQGDVIAILDASGNYKAWYVYDAWGNPLIQRNENGTVNLATLNPIRYRGYYYDSETGFYYLQSRYYDPTIKRFINADACISTGQGFLGYNMFAYCLNNPVNCVDVSGNYAVSATLAATNFWNPIGWIAAAALVVESTIVTVCIIALTYESYQNIFNESSDATGGVSKSGQDQQAPPQVDTKPASTPSSPTPPNNNNNNNNNNKPSLKKLSKQLLKQCGLDAHSIKREFLGRKAKISLYDLAYDTKTGIIYIINKAGQIVEKTYYNIWASAR